MPLRTVSTTSLQFVCHSLDQLTNYSHVVCLSVRLSVCLSVCLSVSLSLPLSLSFFLFPLFYTNCADAGRYNACLKLVSKGRLIGLGNTIMQLMSWLGAATGSFSASICQFFQLSLSLSLSLSCNVTNVCFHQLVIIVNF